MSIITLFLLCNVKLSTNNDTAVDDKRLREKQPIINTNDVRMGNSSQKSVFLPNMMTDDLMDNFSVTRSSGMSRSCNVHNQKNTDIIAKGSNTEYVNPNAKEEKSIKRHNGAKMFLDDTLVDALSNLNIEIANNILVNSVHVEQVVDESQVTPQASASNDASNISKNDNKSNDNVEITENKKFISVSVINEKIANQDLTQPNLTIVGTLRELSITLGNSKHLKTISEEHSTHDINTVGKSSCQNVKRSELIESKNKLSTKRGERKRKQTNSETAESSEYAMKRRR